MTRKQRMSVYAVVVLSLCLTVARLGPAAAAEDACALEVVSLFSDGMVLQQSMKAPVWGWATPGASVQVSFAGQTVKGIAGPDRKWMAWLEPLKASAEPRVLTIETEDSAGTRTQRVQNVLVGEVWICSGQSNMAMGMSQVDNARQEMAAADFPAIRMFRVGEAPGESPWERVRAEWRPCTPVTIASYSAMAYYFARHLHREIGTPVGIVVTAWGGSSAAAWMSREALQAEPVRYNVPVDVPNWRVNIRPATLYNGMLHALIPYAVAGAIWYQGESDASPDANPYLYRLTFPRMIEDWRRKWNRPELPFYFVQLPNLFRHDDDWAILRESQDAALALPQTGMITTLDIGQSKKLHPTNKKAFGERLCNLVLQKEYGFKISADSAAFVESVVEKGRIRLTLDAAGEALKTSDGTPPKAFRIAGADRVFVDAVARIEGRTVVVSSQDVPDPVAVRYAWGADPKVNLCGANGLPVRPFRMDVWPVRGEEGVWGALPVKEKLAVRYPAGSIAEGRYEAWKWSGGPAALTAEQLGDLVRKHSAETLQLLVNPLWLNKPETERPVLSWTTTETSPFAGVDAVKGCTVAINAQLFQATEPFHGLEVELGLRREDGSLCRYRLAIAPMRVYGLSDSEIRILGTDLDNVADRHVYRIAVCPDGGAQVYMDAEPLGMLQCEKVEKPESGVSYMRWGMLESGGQFTANIGWLELDTDGAFGPPSGD